MQVAWKSPWRVQEALGERHRSYREQHGPTPEQSLIEIFNPKEILDQIKSGAISLKDGQDEAIFMVRRKSRELGKPDMMKHPWGRTRRY